MSGQMLLDWLARKRGDPRASEAARHIQSAVARVIAEAKHLTPDLGGCEGTSEMGDAIAACAGG
jgi:3-isopropylmalate dehydrogenase